MTEGRFETIHNLRPKNWDGRRHWSNWHHLYDCEQDHLGRESCPFHDLRSGGQFQYENWGIGAFHAPIAPNHLNNRPDGDRMDFAKGRGTQIGGLGDIPLDLEAGRPVKHTKHPGRTVMFTRKNPLNRGLFGTYPYMPDPYKPEPHVPRSSDEAPALDTRRVVAGGIRAGRSDNLGQAPEWISDPYNDKVDRGRIFHLKAGPVKDRPDDRPPWMPEGEPEKRKKRTYAPFYAGKPCGIINDTEWIADQYHDNRVKKHPQPFRTWHTRTKWSMPTHAPWTSGRITAEPFCGPDLVTTESGLPSLDTYKKVNMTSSIGKEAALHSMTLRERKEVPLHPVALRERKEVPLHPVALHERKEVPLHPVALRERKEAPLHPVALHERKEVPLHPVALHERKEAPPHPMALRERKEVPQHPMA